MTDQAIKDSYWHGWESSIEALVSQFKEFKAAVEEEHGDQEGVDVTLGYLDHTIEIIQGFAGMQAKIEELEIQQEDHGSVKS